MNIFPVCLCDLRFNVLFCSLLSFCYFFFFFFVAVCASFWFRCKLRAINLTFLARLLDLLCVWHMWHIFAFSLSLFRFHFITPSWLDFSSLYINLCLAKIYCSHGVFSFCFSCLCSNVYFGCEDVRFLEFDVWLLAVYEKNGTTVECQNERRTPRSVTLFTHF